MGLNASSKSYYALSITDLFEKKLYDIIDINALRIVTGSMFGQSVDYGKLAFSMLTISSSKPTVPAINKMTSCLITRLTHNMIIKMMIMNSFKN